MLFFSTPADDATFSRKIGSQQGWEKSIAIDIGLGDILYFLFIEYTGALTFLNEYRIWPCLDFFFRRSSIFHIRFFLSRLLYLTLVSL